MRTKIVDNLLPPLTVDHTITLFATTRLLGSMIVLVDGCGEPVG
jgi:hypothetical protein